MAEILYSPDRERVVTTNAWAFLHWLRTVQGVELDGWGALQRWSVVRPMAFAAAVEAFAGGWPGPLPPASHMGRGGIGATPPALAGGGWGEGAAPTTADWLLHADLRPDDTLLVTAPDADPLAAADAAHATVLATPAATLAHATFRRPHRPDLRALRTIIAIGGPMSPEARRRIYTWVKADVMLLARARDTYWGNPLEPVLARPPATPAFITPPPSAPPPR